MQRYIASSWVETAAPGCLRGPDPPWQPALRSISSLEEVVVLMERGGLRHLPDHWSAVSDTSVQKRKHISADIVCLPLSHSSSLFPGDECDELKQVEAGYGEWQQVPPLTVMREQRRNAPHVLWKSPKFNHWRSPPHLLSRYTSETDAWSQIQWLMTLWLQLITIVCVSQEKKTHKIEFENRHSNIYVRFIKTCLILTVLSIISMPHEGLTTWLWHRDSTSGNKAELTPRPLSVSVGVVL